MRWADLAGRPHGDRAASGRSFVFLHGLTFDHRMWDPVLEALPRTTPRSRSICQAMAAARRCLATISRPWPTRSTRPFSTQASRRRSSSAIRSVGRSRRSTRSSTRSRNRHRRQPVPVAPFAQLVRSPSQLPGQLRADVGDVPREHAHRACPATSALLPAGEAASRAGPELLGGVARAHPRGLAPGRRADGQGTRRGLPYLALYGESIRRSGSSCTSACRRPGSSSGRSGITSRTSPIRLASPRC